MESYGSKLSLSTRTLKIYKLLLVLGILEILSAGRSVFASDLPITAPKSIYHNGRYTYLVDDAIAQNLPDKFWEETLSDKNKAYVFYRRGLYGSEHPNVALYYGYRHLMHGSDLPWFIRINLKDACRKSDHVLDIINLAEDPRFQSLITNERVAFRSSKDFLDKCYGGKVTPTEGGHGAISFDGTQAMFNKDTDCSNAVKNYIEIYDIKIVRDNFYRASWIIRDPQCIESIHGVPENMLALMANLPNFWMHKPVEDVEADDYFVEPEGLSRFVMLTTALNRAKHGPSLLLIDKILEQSKRSDIDTPAFGNRWLRSSVTTVIAAFKRCGLKNGNLELYNKRSALYLDTLLKAARSSDAQFLESTQEFIKDMNSVCVEAG